MTNPGPEHVRRVKAFLDETTGSALNYLRGGEAPSGVLRGDEILKLWKAFQEDNSLLTQQKPAVIRMGRRSAWGLRSVIGIGDGIVADVVCHAGPPIQWPILAN